MENKEIEIALISGSLVKVMSDDLKGTRAKCMSKTGVSYIQIGDNVIIENIYKDHRGWIAKCKLENYDKYRTQWSEAPMCWLAFFDIKPPEEEKEKICTCDVWITGCICGVFEEEMKRNC